MTRTRASRFDDVLVRLWNEIEARRLSGDTAGLKAIEREAARIAQDGDEAQRGEAERLLETLRKTQQDEATRAPATARLDAEVVAAGKTVSDRVPEPFLPAPEDAEWEDEDHEDERPRALRLAPLLWVIVLAVVLILNFLGSRE